MNEGFYVEPGSKVQLKIDKLNHYYNKRFEFSYQLKEEVVPPKDFNGKVSIVLDASPANFFQLLPQLQNKIIEQIYKQVKLEKGQLTEESLDPIKNGAVLSVINNKDFSLLLVKEAKRLFQITSTEVLGKNKEQYEINYQTVSSLEAYAKENELQLPNWIKRKEKKVVFNLENYPDADTFIAEFQKRVSPDADDLPIAEELKIRNGFRQNKITTKETTNRNLFKKVMLAVFGILFLISLPFAYLKTTEQLEESCYQKCVAIGEYTEYLEAYPAGIYSATIIENQEEKNWNNVLKEPTIFSLKEFLSTSKLPKFHQLATQKIEVLKKEIPVGRLDDLNSKSFMGEHPKTKASIMLTIEEIIPTGKFASLTISVLEMQREITDPNVKYNLTATIYDGNYIFEFSDKDPYEYEYPSCKLYNKGGKLLLESIEIDKPLKLVE